jgi:hypothetical protein
MCLDTFVNGYQVRLDMFMKYLLQLTVVNRLFFLLLNHIDSLDRMIPYYYILGL